MKAPPRMVVVLTSIGLLSGAFLAGVGLLTKERIADNKQKEKKGAITRAVPGTTSSQKVYEEKDFSVYEGRGEKGTLVGYALHASGVGFQDEITFILGVDSSLARINSLVILDQKETPGLGAKIADRDFFLQYWENKDCRVPLRLRKPAAKDPAQLGPSEINTITGATISSEAVLKIANASLERLRQLVKKGALDGKK